MSDENKEQSGSCIMKIIVKTPKDKQDVEISTDADVKELREKVAQKFSSPVEQVCLIFAGKILKDGESLEQHKIKDGLTIHLVIKSANRSQQQASETATSSSTGTTQSSTPTPNPQQANVSDTPFGLGGLGGLSGLGNLGMGSANFMEMQQRMQRDLMSNPEMLRNMMDNPMVQQLMSNPEVMRQMITSNPQMRELMERNPEITHMLNNPELMRQTMELARNPAMIQELMRSQDRAMSNLESIPGGFNALQRMYHDIQEPMMSAAQEGFGARNPFQSLVGEGSSGDSQQGRENTDPLPNPWAPSSTTSSSGTGSSSTPSTSASGSTGTNTGTSPNMGMFQTPGMQSLMQQMTQNPQLMENMMQAPYVRSMMENMAANPQMTQSILNAHPMFQGNPALQEQMRQQMPALLQQMQNPEMQSAITNPTVMEAISQIQSGMATLQREAPGLFPGLMAAGNMGMAPGSTSSTTTSSTATTSSPGGSTNPSTTTTTTPSGPGITGPSNEQMTNLMSHMMSLMAQGNANQPAEQRYASQLEQLTAMGFVDREANIRALQASLGDVNGAIERLLQQR